MTFNFHHKYGQEFQYTYYKSFLLTYNKAVFVFSLIASFLPLIIYINFLRIINLSLFENMTFSVSEI